MGINIQTGAFAVLTNVRPQLSSSTHTQQSLPVQNNTHKRTHTHVKTQTNNTHKVSKLSSIHTHVHTHTHTNNNNNNNNNNKSINNNNNNNNTNKTIITTIKESKQQNDSKIRSSAVNTTTSKEVISRGFLPVQFLTNQHTSPKAFLTALHSTRGNHNNKYFVESNNNNAKILILLL